MNGLKKSQVCFVCIEICMLVLKSTNMPWSVNENLKIWQREADSADSFYAIEGGPLEWCVYLCVYTCVCVHCK